ncbi:hypothetical protein [Celerinatantimonas diazotrophica]|uniref:Methylguanine DNA methyltransferase ribonuclease-like domain-containing protein n=1 Tax=Celerinatantimonas diazotrophica TaxID=412034 RepID=A0A4R1J7K3_9GAMM|nr:hypothetical protein [Celerinatantimonas diazotrophica]TCK46449.1 hypothetical protein EV690_3729 [Celerinatantimonas diazotrophica]CAG9295174.1 hypothetical protein CEDIAZO_00286 [Celerinatantimonas diazotrophica]
MRTSSIGLMCIHLNHCLLKTKIGPLALSASAAGLSQIRFYQPSQLLDFTETHHDPILEQACQELEEYFLGTVDLCCTYFIQQYIGSHIIVNASDTILA